MVKPEIAFINDRGKVVVADRPEEPNLVREYMPREDVERAYVLAKELYSRTGFAIAKEIAGLLGEALGR